MPSRRTVLGGVAGAFASLAGCSLLPPPPGEEPHPTRDWLYDPAQFTTGWDRYRVAVRTPVSWDDHRQWLDDDTVIRALDDRRAYYEQFGVDVREVDWDLQVGGSAGTTAADGQNASRAEAPGDALPQLRVSAAAFDRQRIERGMNATTEQRTDDYQTMAMFRAPDRDTAYAVGGDYLVDCHTPRRDPDETLRTCIDTQTGRLDRFTAASGHCRRLADELAEDAEFGFEVRATPAAGVVGRGWRRTLDEETTYLKGVVLFADEGRADATRLEDHVTLPEWRTDREHSVRVDGRLGVLTAECPTETVRLDSAPVSFR